MQWHSSLPVSNEEYGFLLRHQSTDHAEAVSELRPDLSASSAADGTRTIAFTDIEDSLRLNALLGDRRWLDVLHAHNHVIGRVTAEHNGTLVKSQGDGSMLAFASARRALICAIAIDRAIAETFTDRAHRSVCASACTWASPSVRRTTSSVILVNYAARVGVIGARRRDRGLVTRSRLASFRTGEFAFADARRVELKGIDGTQVMYPLAVASSEPPPQTEPSLAETQTAADRDGTYSSPIRRTKSIASRSTSRGSRRRSTSRNGVPARRASRPRRRPGRLGSRRA